MRDANLVRDVSTDLERTSQRMVRSHAQRLDRLLDRPSRKVFPEKEMQQGPNKSLEYHTNELVENGVVELYFVRIEYQLEDICTKPLARERLEFLMKKLRMQSMSPETLKKLADEEEE
uniref:Retrovirus-related Pol polyprotein from transposon TNT 1-94 n=1 Tax=Tanacetum cinerariifolium TaxID=118510 RepID=A0A699KAG7_TANCI|nr:retrovirus-related Pol polyprotein from transposon TNT 1-94 [Tanacetum cinerariifolium]